MSDGKWYMEKAVNNVKIEIEINQDQAKIIMRNGDRHQGIK